MKLHTSIWHEPHNMVIFASPPTFTYQYFNKPLTDTIHFIRHPSMPPENKKMAVLFIFVDNRSKIKLCIFRSLRILSLLGLFILSALTAAYHMFSQPLLSFFRSHFSQVAANFIDRLTDFLKECTQVSPFFMKLSSY